MTETEALVFVGRYGPGRDDGGELCMSCLREVTTKTNEPVGVVLQEWGPWGKCPRCGRAINDPAHAEATAWAREIMEAQEGDDD